MIISNKIYDVTQYIDWHSGGKNTIIDNCGTDSTILFTVSGNGGHAHEASAHTLLANYYIGDLVGGQAQTLQINTFSGTPGSGTEPLSVSFSNSVSGPNLSGTTCEINYGEGVGWQTTVCNSSVSNTYDTSGTYNANFRASEGGATVNATQVTTTVYAPSVGGIPYCNAENNIFSYHSGNTTYIQRIKEKPDGDVMYEARAIINGNEHKTKLDASGSILSDKNKEPWNKPTPAMNTTYCDIETTIANNYPNSVIKELEIKYEKVEWEAEVLKSDGLLYKIKYDTNGNLVKDELAFLLFVIGLPTT
jgi:hypothetical protein